MNERIREIVKQAGVFYSYQDQVWELTNGDLERFAELIVRECAGICMIEYDTGLDMAPRAPWLAKQIKEHFGVEP